MHVSAPLHRIEEWRDGFFHSTSLKSLGLHIQLGHEPGGYCRRPRPTYNNDFVIIDVHGIHEVGLDFCNCEHEAPHFKQLLCAWCGNHISAGQAAEWRACAGHGHDPTGVGATQEGELVVLCPACPHPGKNLPENWETSDHQWLYASFFTIDANFCLKHRLVSSNTKDPGLTRGWGYFVEERKYKTYLAENSNSLQEHLRYVGDCQKGEKYLNMDYIVFLALAKFSCLTNFNLSYDIACQWHKKLKNCIHGLPIKLQPGEENVFNFFIPKFHLAAHIEACQTAFSFNWTPGIGQTDREAPECGWANINHVAMSTKEMGPGARREVLDDFFRDSNWKKTTVLGRIMSCKLSEALKAAEDHKLVFSKLEASIRELDLGVSSLATWKAEIEAWEIDHTNLNPFERRVDVMTLAAVCLELAQQDARELEDGTAVSLRTELSGSMLISTGIDLEHSQHHLRTDAASLGLHATDTQRTKVLTCSNALQRHIEVWSAIQTLYMPSVANLCATGFVNSSNDNNNNSGCPRPNSDSGKAEDLQLWLPSEICGLVLCNQKLLELMQFKQQHLHGQGANTCVKKMLDTVEDHLMISHAKYVCARKALMVLSDHVDHVSWDQKLQPLKKSHLRPMGDFTRQLQGTAIMSWIWLTYGLSEDDSEGLQDSLHIE
ncbi:uncharacterized protein BJ212DRAFT_1476730 [Suillus subaureus]|uniref:CxC2-like cysteine cluster KDZ transposase-associated domain-containing protein n=1 Tax=Suillus subaureus TaxID=48587 RepID=A0A9P7EKB0_9AGAM|nr:uncharacterized protein BJ212DRAFT_1476730 [Suillus subaureus]KAG1823881.1 hypothetical protein BJ212DRAFT_1476730 [Suillus subaureus]